MSRPWAVVALVLASCVSGARPPTVTTVPLPPPEAPASTSTSIPSPMPGAPGIGDRLYPSLGNGGYDVQSYDIRLSVLPDLGDSGWVTGWVTIEAIALQDLTQFNLDFVGLNVTNVLGGEGFDEVILPYRREGRELTIDPADYIPTGTRFSVSVSWTGSPGPVPQEAAPFSAGWQRGPDSVYVFSQPDGAAGWFPANDHPGDRADIFLEIEVPSPLQVVTAGEMLASDLRNGLQTARYLLPNIATYQIPLAIGEFEQRTFSEGGRTYPVWVDVDLLGDPRLQIFDLQPEITRFFEDWFGPYPYNKVGALVVEDELPAALETFQMATYTSFSLRAGHEIVAHEISHQWFGNSITLEQWEDIFLNEGLATFAQWLWLEHHEGESAYRSAVERAYRGLSGLSLLDEGVSAADARRRAEQAFPPPDKPRANDLFNPSVYLRAGLAFVALRDLVGDETLRAFFHDYTSRYANQGVTNADFLRLTREHFGSEGESLMIAWTSEPQIPPLGALSPP